MEFAPLVEVCAHRVLLFILCNSYTFFSIFVILCKYTSVQVYVFNLTLYLTKVCLLSTDESYGCVT